MSAYNSGRKYHRWPTVLAAGALAAALLTGCTHSSGSPSSSSAARASNGSSATAAPSGSPSASTFAGGTPGAGPPSSAGGNALPPGLSVVPTLPQITISPTPITATANFGGGVLAQVTHLAYGTVTGSGPGVIANVPEVTFTIAVTNNSGAAVSVDNVQVTAAYGSAKIPGVQANQETTVPLKGALDPGKSGTGTYAFAIPTEEQNNVTVTVWYAENQPTVVFTGSAHQ